VSTAKKRNSRSLVILEIPYDRGFSNGYERGYTPGFESVERHKEHDRDN
jgi:hypothetical protein